MEQWSNERMNECKRNELINSVQNEQIYLGRMYLSIGDFHNKMYIDRQLDRQMNE